MTGSEGRPGPTRRSVLGALCGLLAGAAGAVSATATTEDPAGAVRWSMDGYESLMTEAVGDHLVTFEGREGSTRPAGTGPLEARDVRSGDVVWSAVPDARTAGYHDGLLGASTESTFTALDPDTGEPRWEVDVQDYATEWRVRGNLAYLWTYRSEHVAIDVRDGSVRWRRDDDTHVLEVRRPVDEVLLVETANQLLALDPADGSVRWNNEAANLTSWRRVGDLVLIDVGPELVARALTDGSVAWRYAPDADGDIAIVAVEDDAVYLEERGVGLTALARMDGSVTWRSEMPVPEFNDQVLTGTFAQKPTGSDTVFTVTSDDSLVAVDAGSGETRWTSTPDVPDLSEDFDWTTIDGGCYLEAGTDARERDGELIRVDGGDGGPRWRFDVAGGVLFERPRPGHLLVESGVELLNVDPETGDKRWSQPIHGASSRPYTVVDGTMYGARTVDDGDTVRAFERGLDGERRWAAEARDRSEVGGQMDVLTFEDTLVVGFAKVGAALAFDLTSEGVDPAPETEVGAPGFGARLGALAAGGAAGVLARRHGRD